MGCRKVMVFINREVGDILYPEIHSPGWCGMAFPPFTLWFYWVRLCGELSRNLEMMRSKILPFVTKSIFFNVLVLQVFCVILGTPCTVKPLNLPLIMQGCAYVPATTSLASNRYLKVNASLFTWELQLSNKNTCTCIRVYICISTSNSTVKA